MRGKLMLYVDVCSREVFWARYVSQLKKQVGPGRVSKIYQDDIKGVTYHIGYCIGTRWLVAHVPYMGKVK